MTVSHVEKMFTPQNFTPVQMSGVIFLFLSSWLEGDWTCMPFKDNLGTSSGLFQYQGPPLLHRVGYRHLVPIRVIRYLRTEKPHMLRVHSFHKQKIKLLGEQLWAWDWDFKFSFQVEFWCPLFDCLLTLCQHAKPWASEAKQMLVGPICHFLYSGVF